MSGWLLMGTIVFVSIEQRGTSSQSIGVRVELCRGGKLVR